MRTQTSGVKSPPKTPRDSAPFVAPTIQVVQDLKITFEKVPEQYEHYRGWRFRFRAYLLGLNNIDPIFVKQYLATVDVAESVESLKDFANLEKTEERFDAKIYAALTGAMNAVQQQNHLLDMESQVQESNGRQALK